MSCLPDMPPGRIVTVAGLVLVRQRPGTGNAIFMTLEDETGDRQHHPVAAGVRALPPGHHGRAADQRHRRAPEREGRHSHRRRSFEDLSPLLRRLSDDGFLIDPSAPNDETKRPVQGSWRHPRKTLMPIDAARAENPTASGIRARGNSFVRLAKEKPAVAAAGRGQARRQGAAEGPEFSLIIALRSSPRKRGPSDLKQISTGFPLTRE